MKNKRKILLACIVIFFLLISAYYYVIKNAVFPLSESMALELGEGKYLNFLWMVDGAFNDSRYKESYKVNDKEITDGHKLIECVYQSNKKTCEVKNFEEAFHQLFARNIKMENVYGDGLTSKWYEKKNDIYLFTNLNSCSVSRMGGSHNLKVKEIKNNQITYEITFKDDDGLNIKDFILVHEDGTWKISEAYYHDLCHMDYYLK